MTLDEIKQTPLFKAYIDRVEKLWPGRGDDFALELQKVPDRAFSHFSVGFNREHIKTSFTWSMTPQHWDAWNKFDVITRALK